MVNRKLFFIFLSLSLLSVLAVLPYALTIQEELLKNSGIPLSNLLLAQFVQSTILFSIAIFIGLKFYKKIGFKIPLFEALLSGQNYKKILKEILPISISLGIFAALFIFLVDLLFTYLGTNINANQITAPIWQRLLASFYGGITEEILMRLFLMTTFIFLGMKLLKQIKPGRGIIMSSIILAAVIFGIGHLPITATLTDITPIIIIRAIVLNGIGGIIFGYLYWKKGLESAMIAHFTTDIFILILLPFLI